ncbi:MAG: NfeD family protein [Clostridia bacterium]|nr:NfeD family protein [Clostridia bacterium]
MALCLMLGAGLIIVEVFLPGFGLPGISGVVLVGVGTLLAGMHFGALVAVGLLLVIIAVLAVLISWVLRSAAKGAMCGSELFLHEKDELGGGHADMQAFVGKRGKTMSVLRPAGIGDFDGVRLNVVTEGSFINSGTDVEIIRVEGSRIVVRPTDGL